MANSLEVIVKDPIKGTDLGLSKEPVKQGSSNFSYLNPGIANTINQGSTLNSQGNEAPSTLPKA